MILTFDEYGQVTPKTELQQIKDILIEKITVDQAEKYSYVAIDKDLNISLFEASPTIWEEGELWNNEPKTNFLWSIDLFSLFFDDMTKLYIESKWTTLCFKIADLKGQN
jgi:hypothetical protein